MTPLHVDVRHRWRPEFTLDVSFTSEANHIAIMGPSGAGKSTILGCIAGLVQPQHGTIRIGDRVLLDTHAGDAVPPHLRRVGLMLQEPWLFPRLRVRANLEYGRPSGAGRFRLDEVAEQLEIAHLLERWPRHLSGGEQQRVALGRALLSEPDLLVVDEPFSHLDAPRRDRLVTLFEQVRAHRHLPWILVTHDPVVARRLADDVVVLDAGRLARQGHPSQIFAAPNGHSPSAT